MSDRAFNEVLRQRVETVMRDIMETTPELDGITVTFTYNPTLDEVEPQNMVFARLRTPVFLSRMCYNACRNLVSFTQAITQELQRLAPVPEEPEPKDPSSEQKEDRSQ